jgi:23S rRNA (guanosine2251-2'-O)-methyltransferase
MNLICGINPVLEALGAGTRHFDRLLVVKGIRNRRVNEAIAKASLQGIPLRFEARETLDRMSGGVPHQGVVAVVSAKPVITLEQLVAEARQPALVVVLDGVEDPRNLGAVLRTVECSGADGVVLPERHSAGLSEAVGRSSAGALEHVKVARVGNVAQAIEELKAKGLWVVGFDAEGTERWDKVDLKQPTALVLGGEGRGIRRLVRERCDHLVSLPLFGHVASLNVSVVAGIALYEVVRQRGAVPSHVKPIPVKRAHAAEPIVGPGADDQEHDPGARPGGRPQPAHDAEFDEEDQEALPTGIVDIHEEAAWGGATVVKHRDHDRRGGGDRPARPQRRDHRGPRRDGPRDGPPREAPPREGASPQAPAGPPPPAGEADPRRGNKRRRRRGRGPGAGPGGGGQPRPGGAPTEAGAARPSEPRPEGQGAPREGGGAPGDDAARGRRRHRRRRR